MNDVSLYPVAEDTHTLGYRGASRQGRGIGGGQDTGLGKAGRIVLVSMFYDENSNPVIERERCISSHGRRWQAVIRVILGMGHVGN